MSIIKWKTNHSSKNTSILSLKKRKKRTKSPRNIWECRFKLKNPMGLENG